MSDFLTTDARFSIVPEWVMDAAISDRAYRLYGLLARYADVEHRCFPARSTLATRLRCSTSSIDRAIAELERVQAITVKRRGGEPGSSWTSSVYTLRVAAPVKVGSRTGAGREAARVKVGSRTGDERTRTTEREPLNETRSATPSEVLGARAQAAVAAAKSKGITDEEVASAVAWLHEHDYPVAAFRIEAHAAGKPQPPRDGERRKATLLADTSSHTTDWAAEAAAINPATGEVDF